MARAAGASRHSDDHIGLIEVVNRHAQQILNTTGATTKAHVSNIEAISICGLEGIHDIFGAGIGNITWEDIVVAKKGCRSYAGDIVGDVNTAHCSGRIEVTSDSASYMGTMFLNCFRCIAATGSLVVEDFSCDHFVIGEAVIAQLSLTGVTSI